MITRLDTFLKLIEKQKSLGFCCINTDIKNNWHKMCVSIHKQQTKIHENAFGKVILFFLCVFLLLERG